MPITGPRTIGLRRERPMAPAIAPTFFCCPASVALFRLEDGKCQRRGKIDPAAMARAT